jgi:hypothetical protein
MSKEKKKPKNVLLSYLFLDNAIHIIAIDQVMIFFKNIIFVCVIFIVLSLISKFFNCADAIFKIISFFVQRLPKLLSQYKDIFGGLVEQSKEQFADLFKCIETQANDALHDNSFFIILVTLGVFSAVGLIIYILCGIWRWISKWIIISEAAKKDPRAKSVFGFKIFNLVLGICLWVIVGIMVYSFIKNITNQVQSIPDIFSEKPGVGSSSNIPGLPAQAGA